MKIFFSLTMEDKRWKQYVRKIYFRRIVQMQLFSMKVIFSHGYKSLNRHMSGVDTDLQ